MAEDSSAHDAASDELAALRVKVKQQAREITHLAEVLKRKNRELDALHLVWCDGGCPGGVHRWQDESAIITEELVKLAERNTRRLRTWYNGVKFRYETYGPEPRDPAHQFSGTDSEWHRQYAARAAAKTDLPARNDHRECRAALGRAWGTFLDTVPGEFWDLLRYRDPELHALFRRVFTSKEDAS
jgi:hypothetical protein